MKKLKQSKWRQKYEVKMVEKNRNFRKNRSRKFEFEKFRSFYKNNPPLGAHVLEKV